MLLSTEDSNYMLPAEDSKNKLKLSYYFTEGSNKVRLLMLLSINDSNNVR